MAKKKKSGRKREENVIKITTKKIVIEREKK